ncbi:MAG: glutathione S-transferase [Gammaproteobacteria bacterium]|nr:glutathione S-transferase [Gammaproteobacteria bacterium]
MKDDQHPRIALHGTERSGHAHRVVLLLRMLAIPYRFVSAPVEIRRSDEFLRLNPLGQIPVLEDGPVVICDSNAILVYLAGRYARGSQWLPEEPLAAARMQRWLSIAAGEMKHGPALARLIAQWGEPGDRDSAARTAVRLFRFMEGHLADRAYLAADHATIADLACYSYTAHAPEGGISLQPYRALRAWLARVEALPRFEPMPRSPLPPEIPLSG